VKSSIIYVAFSSFRRCWMSMTLFLFCKGASNKHRKVAKRDRDVKMHYILYSKSIKFFSFNTQKQRKRDNLIKNPLNSFQQPSRLTFIESRATEKCIRIKHFYMAFFLFIHYNVLCIKSILNTPPLMANAKDHWECTSTTTSQLNCSLLIYHRPKTM
jgi:hypothetical protein